MQKTPSPRAEQLRRAQARYAARQRAAGMRRLSVYAPPHLHPLIRELVRRMIERT